MKSNYAEYTGPGNRAVTVTLLESHWDSKFNKWEVTSYVSGKVIERRTFTDEVLAERYAQEFVDEFGGGGKVLLNE